MSNYFINYELSITEFAALITTADRATLVGAPAHPTALGDAVEVLTGDAEEFEAVCFCVSFHVHNFRC